MARPALKEKRGLSFPAGNNGLAPLPIRRQNKTRDR